jgi:integrase
MPHAFNYQTLKNLSEPGRYTDPHTKGLHLWVKPTLKKYWIYRYTLAGKRQNVSLGPFPILSIREARLKAQKAALGLSEGLNPKQTPSAPKDTGPNKSDIPTFAAFSEEWVATNESAWSNKKHADQWRYTLRDFAYPVIGHLRLNEIDERHILAILQPMWLTKTETASRLRGRLERIFTAARVKKLREGTNPATWRGYLDAVLPSPKAVKRRRGERHHKALPYREIPRFMTQLREQEGLAAQALEFLILNANRTSEVLQAKWEEINNDLWIIPATRMKAKKEHRVPLCRRSIEILQIAHDRTHANQYIFSTRDRPLSNMALSAVLKRMGVDATVHGFRSTFRDWVAEETDHSHEVAEMALAHTIGNRVEAAYRRGDLLARRRRMMEHWESYCHLAPTGNVLLIKAA